mgnify:FL=1
MFKIVALLCVMGVNGQNLCMVGEIPSSTNFRTEQDCINTINNIGNAINEEFLKRKIGLSMKCEKIGDKV